MYFRALKAVEANSEEDIMLDLSHIRYSRRDRSWSHNARRQSEDNDAVIAQAQSTKFKTSSI